MSEDLPAPPVPADLDLRDLQWMPLDVVRLRDSELAAVADAEAFRVAVISWCVAWHQVPASSLPDDDAALARLLGFGRDLKGWRKVRAAGALRGWQRHADGRLYHPVVAEKANQAGEQKAAHRRRRERDAERLRRWRESRGEGGDETPPETGDETGFVAKRQDKTGPDRTGPSKRASSSSSDVSPPAATTTATTTHPSRDRVGIDPGAVRQAIESGVLSRLLVAFGVEQPLDTAWVRAANRLPLGVVATILGWRIGHDDPVRYPRGLDHAREAWKALSDDERRALVTDAAGQYGFPPPAERQPAESAP